MGQGDSARDFDTSESMENAGILDVFPIFHTARLGQKIRRSPLSPLCGVALNKKLSRRTGLFGHWFGVTCYCAVRRGTDQVFSESEGACGASSVCAVSS